MYFRTLNLGRGSYYRMQAYLSFIQHERPEIVCILDVAICTWFDTGPNFEDPTLA